MQVYTDFLRIALEVINLALSMTLSHNEHFIYALLERQHVFAPLRNHERFADLLDNIDRVLEHFGQGLGLFSDTGQPSDDVWSVDRVLDHIRSVSREWRPDNLKPLADLKFTYEQEASPEDFFTPYIWSLVYEHSGIRWQVARITLFSMDSVQALAESDPADSSLPILSSIDVDETATSDLGPESVQVVSR
uniref:Dymeclin n=1 Tax=Haptolina ericina TaxID=156174 RepID=A0A7S3APN3_9EUKA